MNGLVSLLAFGSPILSLAAAGKFFQLSRSIRSKSEPTSNDSRRMRLYRNCAICLWVSVLPMAMTVMPYGKRMMDRNTARELAVRVLKDKLKRPVDDLEFVWSKRIPLEFGWPNDVTEYFDIYSGFESWSAKYAGLKCEVDRLRLFPIEVGSDPECSAATETEWKIAIYVWHSSPSVANGAYRVRAWGDVQARGGEGANDQSATVANVQQGAENGRRFSFVLNNEPAKRAQDESRMPPYSSPRDRDSIRRCASIDIVVEFIPDAADRNHVYERLDLGLVRGKWTDRVPVHDVAASIRLRRKYGRGI